MEQCPQTEEPQLQQDAPQPAAPAESTDSAPEALDPQALQAKLEEANRERDQFRTLLQRVQADFINFKRRTEEERQEMQRQASAQTILKLLPVLDDLHRALEHLPKSPQERPEGIGEGLTLIQRKLQDILDAEGLARIEAEGKPFDPWEHEALSYEETDTKPEGAVLRVIRQGYRLKGRVLRPAQVAVAKAKPPGPQEEEPPQGLENNSQSSVNQT